MKKYGRRYLKINSLGIIIFILPLCLARCRNTEKISVSKSLPRNLNEAISYLDKEWNYIEKLKFKNQPERDAVISEDFSTGLWIRNNWIYGNRAPDLVNYFHKIGIYAPDDISWIILISFHRQLNHNDVKLYEQIKPIKAYWKSISDCEEKSKKRALFNYNKYDIGNPIVILMPVDTAINERNAVEYNCPKIEWKFNPKKDLMITGVIVRKQLNDTANILFSVRINKMNYPNTTIFMDTVKIGDIKDFSLENLTITPSK